MIREIDCRDDSTSSVKGVRAQSQCPIDIVRPCSPISLRKSLLLFSIPVLAALLPLSLAAQSIDVTVDPSTFTWRTLKVGAGGWITGIDIAPDGTKVIRTDTYGAYQWIGSSWKQLVTAESMPRNKIQSLASDGVYEVRIAPSSTKRFYMMYLGNVYRSDDQGSIWTQTAFQSVAASAGDAYHVYGQRMAVDPANPDIVYVGTPTAGLWVTRNAGASWTEVLAVPRSQGVPTDSGSETSYPGFAGIAFDPTSGRMQGGTKIIYVSSFGNGVYRSSDSGASWVNLSGGPSNVSHGRVAADGAYYVTGNLGTSIWRFSSGQWANITPPSESSGTWDTADTIATDPFNPAHILVGRASGYIAESTNRGASWGLIDWSHTRSAADVPWLGWTDESSMSVGDMAFDPKIVDKLWFAEGIGVWNTNLPSDPSQNVAWTSQSAGIEQLVTNAVLSPPGGKPLLGVWDRAVFRVSDPDVYPSTHGPDNKQEILHGWSFDYSADNPNYIVGLMNAGGFGQAGASLEKSGFSLDGGCTWLPFSSYPPFQKTNQVGGTMAVAARGNIVWVPEVNGTPYVTKDGGSTWRELTFPGVPVTGETGWGMQYYYNRHIAVADKNAAGTFYLYNYFTGIYRSVNGGDTWNLMRAGEITPHSQWNALLQGVPGRSGHLFFTGGTQDYPGANHPAAEPFMHSTDGGAHWTPLPNVYEVRAFGLGKAKTVGSYPSLYIVGWVDDVYGVYRSDDEGQSWTPFGTFPLGSLDQIRIISGDANKYGVAYIGFVGSGFAYYAP